LRRLRAAAVLTGDEVAARLGWSPSKLSRIETGNSSIAADDLQLLLETYQVSGSLLDRLASLARSARQRGWWDAYGDTLLEGYSTLLALESDAESELSYSQMVVPGILQSEGYARLMARSGGDSAPEEVSRIVTVRLTQQRILTRSNPLKLVAILDEACLRRQVGPPGIMHEQLLHLIEMARLPNITVQIFPFSAGYHRAVIGGFKILHFSEEGSTDVVFIQNMTSDLFIEESADVYKYARAFGELRLLVSEEEESLTLLTQIASETR
jgi:transcriptional regulator with XRE-family HTH domain